MNNNTTSSNNNNNDNNNNNNNTRDWACDGRLSPPGGFSETR